MNSVARGYYLPRPHLSSVALLFSACRFHGFWLEYLALTENYRWAIRKPRALPETMTSAYPSTSEVPGALIFIKHYLKQDMSCCGAQAEAY